MQDDRPTPRVVVIGAGALGQPDRAAPRSDRPPPRHGRSTSSWSTPRPHRARGTAFGTTDPQHLLNVAGRRHERPARRSPDTSSPGGRASTPS